MESSLFSTQFYISRYEKLAIILSVIQPYLWKKSLAQSQTPGLRCDFTNTSCILTIPYSFILALIYKDIHRILFSAVENIFDQLKAYFFQYGLHKSRPRIWRVTELMWRLDSTRFSLFVPSYFKLYIIFRCFTFILR